MKVRRVAEDADLCASLQSSLLVFEEDKVTLSRSAHEREGARRKSLVVSVNGERLRLAKCSTNERMVNDVVGAPREERIDCPR